MNFDTTGEVPRITRLLGPAAMNQDKFDGGGEIALYKDPQGGVRLDVRLERETVWLSLDQMAKLFRQDKSNFTALT